MLSSVQNILAHTWCHRRNQQLSTEGALFPEKIARQDPQHMLFASYIPDDKSTTSGDLSSDSSDDSDPDSGNKDESDEEFELPEETCPFANFANASLGPLPSMYDLATCEDHRRAVLPGVKAGYQTRLSSQAAPFVPAAMQAEDSNRLNWQCRPQVPVQMVPVCVPQAWSTYNVHEQVRHGSTLCKDSRAAIKKGRASSTAMGASQSPQTTLRTTLEELAHLDPRRVLMVRQIRELGLTSPSFLDVYFSRFGSVERVCVNHSPQKLPSGSYKSNLRPAGFCFVVMADIASAEAALSKDKQHVVLGVTISVSRFNSVAASGHE